MRQRLSIYVTLNALALSWLSCASAKEDTIPEDAPQERAAGLRPTEDDGRKPKDARDLGKGATGVFVNSPVGQGGYAPEFMFRGFPNGGLTLFDGVARGFIAGGVELAGVDRVEFVKGVTSMLYGTVTSASGAAANYITKKPEADFFLKGASSVGSFGYVRQTIDANTPLDSNRNVLFRMNLAAQTKNSFIDFVYGNSVYANPTLKMTFENGDELTLRGEYAVQHYRTNFGLPTYQPSPLFLQLPRSLYAAVPANEKDWMTDFDGRARYEHRFNKDWSAALILDYYGSYNTYGWLTQWQYDGLRSVDFGSGARTHYFTRNFDFQTQITGKVETGPATHKLFFGVERWAFYTRHRDRISAIPFGALDLLAPIYPAYVSYAGASPANGDDSGWTNSAFGQDLIDIGSDWTALLGARYDYLANYQTLNDPTGALSGTAGSTASKGFTPKLSPRGGLIYRPLTNTSLHAAFGQSFIPNIGVRIVGGKLAPPEEDTLYEAGIRQSFFENRVDFDIGVFDVTRKNVPSFNPFNPNGFYQLVTGRQHSHGVEASARAQINKSFSVGLAATFLHALVTQDSNTPSQAGSDLLGAPRRVFNLSGNYVFDDERLKGLEIGAGFFYAGETQATLPNTRGFTLPPIKNFSLNATYRYDKHLVFSLSAVNLTNSANFTSTGALLRGEPRTITASVNWGY